MSVCWLWTSTVSAFICSKFATVGLGVDEEPVSSHPMVISSSLSLSVIVFSVASLASGVAIGHSPSRLSFRSPLAQIHSVIPCIYGFERLHHCIYERLSVAVQ